MSRTTCSVAVAGASPPRTRCERAGDAGVPREARSYQGASAGVVTRLAAGIVDVLLVAVSVAGTYAAWAAVRFVLEPREFRMPDPSLLWS